MNPVSEKLRRQFSILWAGKNAKHRGLVGILCSVSGKHVEAIHLGTTGVGA